MAFAFFNLGKQRLRRVNVVAVQNVTEVTGALRTEKVEVTD
jgi:hypothetical protein